MEKQKIKMMRKCIRFPIPKSETNDHYPHEPFHWIPLDMLDTLQLTDTR